MSEQLVREVADRLWHERQLRRAARAPAGTFRWRLLSGMSRETQRRWRVRARGVVAVVEEFRASPSERGPRDA